MKSYDVRAVIGRFQPPHKDHIERLGDPAARAGDLVVVLLGSSFKPRTFKDPLTWEFRFKLIEESVKDYCDQNDLDYRKLAPIIPVPIRDYLYSDNQWIVQVQSEINKAVNKHYTAAVDYRVTLHGCDKDSSTRYLSYFPQWNLELYEMTKKELAALNATDIRNSIFDGSLEWASNVYPSARRLLMEWKDSKEARDIVEDYKFVEKYKKSWQNVPYPVIFQTVDNVIVYKGNILLIKRKASPGKGLWALPGGFAGYDEKLLDSAIRECREETKLFLKQEWLKAEEVFDAPGRSLRGRTITKGFLWSIPENLVISGVQGGDDAAKAQWFPIGHVLDNMQEVLFEDHSDLISQLLKYL